MGRSRSSLKLRRKQPQAVKTEKMTTATRRNRTILYGAAVVAVLSLIAAVGVLATTTSSSKPILSDAIQVTEDSIVNIYPHDKASFTQGLFFDEGHLIESTGIRKQSTLRRVEVATGRVNASVTLSDDSLFGEGSTRWGDTYIMLTWIAKRGFIFDRKTLTLLKEFSFSTTKGEGWGITHDGKSLIVSDGTSYLHFWDPISFKEQKKLQVTYKGKPVRMLNELEYAFGELYANVWFQTTVYRIDPSNGKVIVVIDCSLLAKKAKFDRNNADAVLNGIAIDETKQKLYMTGKLWDSLFEIDMTKLK